MATLSDSVHRTLVTELMIRASGVIFIKTQLSHYLKVKSTLATRDNKYFILLNLRLSHAEMQLPEAFCSQNNYSSEPKPLDNH